MASVYKTAGQAAPIADTDTVLYTVPVSKSFVASSIVICNRNVAGVNSAYRVAVVPSGETLAAKHYILYEQFIAARDSISKVLGLTLAAGDTLVVRSSSADLSFSLFGNEIG